MVIHLVFLVQYPISLDLNPFKPPPHVSIPCSCQCLIKWIYHKPKFKIYHNLINLGLSTFDKNRGCYILVYL